MEQEQRCQALLAVERAQRAVLDVAVDEVESDVFAFGECFVQDIEKALADVGRPSVGASLGVVPLDEGDLDARHRRAHLSRAARTTRRTT